MAPSPPPRKIKFIRGQTRADKIATNYSKQAKEAATKFAGVPVNKVDYKWAYGITKTWAQALQEFAVSNADFVKKQVELLDCYAACGGGSFVWRRMSDTDSKKITHALEAIAPEPINVAAKQQLEKLSWEFYFKMASPWEPDICVVLLAWAKGKKAAINWVSSLLKNNWKSVIDSIKGQNKHALVSLSIQLKEAGYSPSKPPFSSMDWCMALANFCGAPEDTTGLVALDSYHNMRNKWLDDRFKRAMAKPDGIESALQDIVCVGINYFEPYGTFDRIIRRQVIDYWHRILDQLSDQSDAYLVKTRERLVLTDALKEHLKKRLCAQVIDNLKEFLAEIPAEPVMGGLVVYSQLSPVLHQWTEELADTLVTERLTGLLPLKTPERVWSEIGLYVAGPDFMY